MADIQSDFSSDIEEGVAATPGFLRWAFVAPFLLWGIVVIGALLGRPPTAPAELESLSAAWHMWQDHVWMPLIIGTGSGDQPPLHLWLILLGWEAFGVGDAWPRLLSVAMSFGTLWLAGRSALVLWPHRALTELYARILMSGVMAFVLLTTMVQAEPIGLFLTALGFHALARLWHAETIALRWWALFALALLGSLFAIGNMAFLLLPATALLAQRRGAPGNVRIGFRLVPRWHVPLALSLLPAILSWVLWMKTLHEAGIAASYLGFGNGWINPATEATRREIWSLLLVPMLLYPWICWKTLWRALAKQLRGRTGHSFRICLLYFAAAILAGFVSGWQMQGMAYIVLPLSLLGARLLATQVIRAKDFHAIVPSLLALLLGLFFFLMNIVPTAHLDALWRQLFDVPLPIWIGGIGMTSGLVLLVAGYGIAQLSPMHLLSRSIQVAILPVLLMTCVNIEFPFNLRQFFDLEPVAERLRQLEEAGQPLAVFGPYRGEFDYYGRLGSAPIALPSREAAIAWAHANPAGVIVSYFDGSPLRLPSLPYYRGVARDRWVAIWPTSAVIETGGKALDTNF